MLKCQRPTVHPHTICRNVNEDEDGKERAGQVDRLLEEVASLYNVNTVVSNGIFPEDPEAKAKIEERYRRFVKWCDLVLSRTEKAVKESRIIYTQLLGTQNNPVKNPKHHDPTLKGSLTSSFALLFSSALPLEIIGQAAKKLYIGKPRIIYKAIQLEEGIEQRKIQQYKPLQLIGRLESLSVLLETISLLFTAIFKMVSLFFWLQVQFFNIWQSTDHTRCILNICARFIYHDECWGFTSAGEWLRPHAEHVNDKMLELLFVCSVPPVVVHTAWPF